jgi:hypothetical protein
MVTFPAPLAIGCSHSLCLAWESDFTHVNDQHTIQDYWLHSVHYHSCPTTFVHGFIWILKLGNS